MTFISQCKIELKKFCLPRTVVFIWCFCSIVTRNVWCNFFSQTGDDYFILVGKKYDWFLVDEAERNLFTPSCNLSEKQSKFQHTHHSHQRHPNKPETGRMTRSCMSLNQKERVQSGSQPAGTELPEALLTVSVSLVLSTNRCAISWAMWPDPKNISNPKVESCHKIKVINQHNYICTFFHFESLMRGWKHQKSTSRKNILAR